MAKGAWLFPITLCIMGCGKSCQSLPCVPWIPQTFVSWPSPGRPGPAPHVLHGVLVLSLWWLLLHFRGRAHVPSPFLLPPPLPPAPCLRPPSFAPSHSHTHSWLASPPGTLATARGGLLLLCARRTPARPPVLACHSQTSCRSRTQCPR